MRTVRWIPSSESQRIFLEIGLGLDWQSFAPRHFTESSSLPHYVTCGSCWHSGTICLNSAHCHPMSTSMVILTHRLSPLHSLFPYLVLLFLWYFSFPYWLYCINFVYLPVIVFLIRMCVPWGQGLGFVQCCAFKCPDGAWYKVGIRKTMLSKWKSLLSTLPFIRYYVMLQCAWGAEIWADCFLCVE